MSDGILSFSNMFPEANESDWVTRVEKALKGKGVESLARENVDGISIKPLYRESDWATSQDLSGLPGQAPYLRGRATRSDAGLAWDIRQIFAHPSPEQTNRDILADLERGVTSVELQIDSNGADGVAIRSLDDMASALDGVLLDIAPLGLDLKGASASNGVAMAACLAAYLARKGYDAGALKVNFNLDPIGALAGTGNLGQSSEDAIAAAIDFVKQAADDFPESTLLRVDARRVHEAGGSDVQELAFLIGSGVAYVKAGVEAGLPADIMFGSLLFTMSVGSDFLPEIAKLRAARRLWSNVAQAFHVEGDAGEMKLQVVSSGRMLTRRNAYSNILRTASACFGAGVGGADIICIRPFTDAIGLPSPAARRIARNIQVIAQEESSLGRVMDPVGGAWSVETIANEMAEKAWASFQAYESAGGVVECLKNGSIQAEVTKVRAERLKKVAKRKTPITGVSDYPLLGEDVPDVVVPNEISPENQLELIKAGGFGTVHKAIMSGASISALKPEGAATPIEVLAPMSLAEPFERLRTLAEDYFEKTGSRPRIFISALGPVADHSARLTFAQNFFAAGGIEAVSNNEPLDAVEAAFRDSKAIIACICGSDTQYETAAEPTAKALKQAGAARVYLAGRPGDAETSLKSAGVDEFIHIGVDVVARLEIALSEIGLEV